VLTVRGRVGISEVDGIPAEYESAARRYLGDEVGRILLRSISRAPGWPGSTFTRRGRACSIFNRGFRARLVASCEHGQRGRAASHCCDCRPRGKLRPSERSSTPLSVRAGPTWANLSQSPYSRRRTWSSLWPIISHRTCCRSLLTRPKASSATQPFIPRMGRCSFLAVYGRRVPPGRFGPGVGLPWYTPARAESGQTAQAPSARSRIVRSPCA
jgi:hypothetical protein